MEISQSRMIISGNPPDESDLIAWTGNVAYGYWQQLTRLIEQSYPSVFTPEWLYGGKKHGWSLRYKKSKSFCTLVPEKNRCMILIVFGAKERDKVEVIRETLSPQTREAYDSATTWHDGKWLLLPVDSETVVQDIELLLAVKRRPNKQLIRQP